MNISSIKFVEVSEVFKDCPLAWEVFVYTDMMSDFNDESSNNRLVSSHNIINELISMGVDQEEKVQIDVVVNRLRNLESGIYIDIEAKGNLPCQETIERANRFKSAFESYSSDDDFYNNLNQLEIVHYHCGNNKFVRCRVNERKELVPFAFVGKWRRYDFPIDYKNMIPESFKPNTKNVYESGNKLFVEEWTLGGILRRPVVDPTDLPEINLEKK